MISSSQAGDPLLPESDWRRAFRRRLLAWYAKNARDLPWRKTADPYSIWISETMLQQTQVTTVKPYFTAFLQRFPNACALADADQAEVLRYWEGLGYYRRARQLHDAARQIVERHAGKFPIDFESVYALPGVGRYTAGAILSIALDQRLPILEANTIRLHCRLLGYRDDPARAAGQRLLWSMAEAVLPRQNSGRLNQALMELGSQICISGKPRCESCPVEPLCRARIERVEQEVPYRREKVEPIQVLEASTIVRFHCNNTKSDRVLLVRYSEQSRRWAGLWDFPRFEVPEIKVDNGAAIPDQQLIDGLFSLTGLKCDARFEHRKTIRHGVTKYRITLECFDATLKRTATKPTSDHNAGLPQSVAECRWVTREQLTELPLSSTGRRIAALV